MVNNVSLFNIEHTFKKVHNDEEEMFVVSPDMNKNRTSSIPLDVPVENSSLYCQKCKLKYEGDCPEHGPLIRFGDAEANHGDRNTEAHVVDNVGRKMPGRKKEKLIKPDFSGNEEMYTCLQCYLLFSTLEHLHAHKTVMHCDNYLDLSKHGEHSSGVLCNDKIKKVKKTVNKEGDNSAVEIFSIDNIDSRTCQREECVDSSGYQDIELDDVETHGAHETTLQNYVCTRVLDTVVSISEENAEFQEADMSYELQSDMSIEKCKRIHCGEKLYTCDVCGVSIGVAKNLKRHQKIHGGEKPFKCDVCDLGFFEKNILNRHKRVHTGDRPFKCDICSEAFTQNRNLQVHIRTHTGEKPYVCGVCGTSFADTGSLVRHKRIHTGEKPYKCDVCSAAFSDEGNRNRHKRKHTGEKPYKCDVCSIGFAQNSDLKAHKRIHMGEKPYKCDICNVRFTRNSHLHSHKRTHTGEKPYKCDICDAVFAQSSDLIPHKRIHTGEKPYECDVCGVKFVQNGHLQSHKRIHTGEKPYKCEKCDLAFARGDTLQRHKKKHT